MSIPVQSINNPPSEGFFHDLVEKSVDLPPDGRNGECFVQFNRPACTMTVPMVNGKREGMAIIRGSENSFYTRVEYKNGLLSGIVEQLFRDGIVQLRGHLNNGIETGLFTEYDHNGNVVWMGYYRNGEAYSELVRSKTMKGYYEERRMSDYLLMSIAQYDGSSRDKNGRCLEYENGNWTGESLYEKGMKKRVIREYRDGSVILYDEKGEKTKVMKCDSIANGMWNTGLSVYNHMKALMEDEKNTGITLYDIDSGKEYGVNEVDRKYYAIKFSEEENYVMEGDLTSRETRYCENDKWEVISSEIHCIDLNANGRRWEGSVRNGKPFGYGILFNEEGKKEYEGFMMNGLKSCYGKEYYKDIEKVKYDGCFFEDKRFGCGIVYDRNGDIKVDDMWKNDHSYLIDDNNTIDSLGSEAIILPNTHSEVNFFIIPSWFYYLTTIGISCKSLVNVHHFQLDGLSSLERVAIGEDALTHPGYVYSPGNNSVYGCFRIINCPKLEAIRIGQHSFLDYHFFSLRNLPSLKIIEMKDDCFQSLKSFSLIGFLTCLHSSTDLPQLTSLVIGCEALSECQSVVFESMETTELID